MKPLTLEETRLKEEMKERCLSKGQYIDENAKAKFEMLCHLEDFEVQYWELQQENKQLKERMDNQEYLLLSQGKELKNLYSKIEKTIKYLEEPNRDSFDYSKAKLLDILNEESED